MIQNTVLEKTTVLMLSTCFEPMFQASWKRALQAVFGGRAEVIESHDFITIGTSSGPIPLPITVRFISGIIAAKIKKFRGAASLTKKNLLIRDEEKCQYCLGHVTIKSGTIDHVIPRSKGGMHSWENVVLACSKCNQKKGCKLPSEFHLKLAKKPRTPLLYEIINHNIKTNNR
jgi:hypothetical protein